MDLQSELFEEDRIVTQLHWGGGTPTFISDEQMRELMHITREYFNLLNNDQGEYSLEIDPRRVGPNTLQTLRQIGFNRLSFGIQDFNITVQKAVHRLQSELQTTELITQARQLGFKSISVDLIYGLPFQTVSSFNETLAKIIAISPDRLSLFNYAHMPHLFPTQRRINSQDLPTPTEKLTILKMAIEFLTQAGYIYIGMDHFAKPTDPLALAQQNRSLHRNFQGYSTQVDCDLIGLGVSSISKVNHGYMQNTKKLDQYYQKLDHNQLATSRGVILSLEDILRRKIINDLICYFEIDKIAINKTFDIDFDVHFVNELSQLSILEQDGLVKLLPDSIIITPPGKLLVRHVCKVFDQYLSKENVSQFSKII
jgi:oxygen-independent coproporphyrinogen-3 oxidase